MNKKITYILIVNFLLFLELDVYSQEDSTRSTKNYTIDEVVVTGTRNETEIRHLPMSISIIKRNQIEHRYEQSLLPILTEQIPGFFTTSRSIMGYGISTGAAGSMSLRGIGGNPTTGLLILIDGHPQYMGLMGHPLSDAYQSMLAEKVEVVRGPASVLYGSNAMGGVINIVTRKQQDDGIKNHARVSYGSYNTLTTELSNQIRQGRFNSIVTGSYNRTDGHRSDMEFEQYGGYAKLGYELNRVWNLFADINLTHYNTSNPGTMTSPVFDNDSRITRGVTSFSLENNYNHTSGALKLYYNWGRHKINDGYSREEEPLNYRFHSTDKMLGLTWYQSVTLFTGNRITVGADYQHIGGEAWNKFLNGNHTDIVNKSENEIAGYMDFRQSIGRIFTFNAGVRIDHHSQSGTEWIPQVGISTQFQPNAELKALMSKGFRNPTLRELYMFGSKNPDLKPERIMSYELSWSQRLMKNTLSYGINLFHINGDNTIQTVVMDDKHRKNINTGKIENWGVETDMSYRPNRSWNISANYSWLRMVHPVIAAPEHKLYAGADFTRGRWNISTGIMYVRGLYTEVKPSKIKEDFILWNMRGSYRVFRFADLFVRGENLLAQSYEINIGYPMPEATFMGGVNINF
ncbi:MULTISPECIES: TonB-dependent receptor plug domain-containing protein [Sanguibacteroides]|uniref:Ligand-gated channel n=1 Tax=Sanguibacteroides justesenii TaxID=1547597 RepID=A0A0C3R5K7_9PORP|nr:MULTISPECIES: TonB-dependent receptor [Sanguibacteroides]KIO43287.1 ligand-gated channel [Sanguibacteroides justesenii]KIO45000.1 ligand-gated channel [Sanguibacteroides justesenii]PXZ42841.1 TonB-dependent receptor [Sanguibacteroides justesenii]